MKLLSKDFFFVNIKHSLYEAPIAQLVEQIPFKDKVAGSSPAGRTKKTRFKNLVFC